MIKFFKMPTDFSTEHEGVKMIQPNKLEHIVNTYAKENNLKIKDVSVIECSGIFVLFEPIVGNCETH